MSDKLLEMLDHLVNSPIGYYYGPIPNLYNEAIEESKKSFEEWGKLLVKEEEGEKI